MPHQRVVAIGAHPDDIELGCGGTLARHSTVGDEVVMLVLTNGQAGPGQVESRQAEAHAAAGVLGAEIVFAGLNDGELMANRETVEIVESLLRRVHPSTIYTHSENDAHQDHRNAAAATLSAARNFSTVLHYQAPSTRAFAPNIFVALDEESLALKLEALRQHESQVSDSLRVDIEAVDATARYWGSCARTRLAEGYEVTRALVNPTTAGMVIGDRRSGRESYVGPERRVRVEPEVERAFLKSRTAVAKKSDAG